ncbi:hypothetical protein WEI85_43755 [Actinomycetes bacterium KLBMP 9797]
MTDRQSYLEGGLSPLACGHCGARVRVKKASPMQTSVQWSRCAVRSCAEFEAHDGPNALVHTCTRLRASVEQAVRDGHLGVG